jgi:hypothetical protein
VDIPERTVTITVDYAAGRTTVDYSDGYIDGWDNLIGRPTRRVDHNALPVGVLYVGESDREAACSANWTPGCGLPPGEPARPLRGHIDRLEGPGRGADGRPRPALHRETQITIFALRDVRISSDLAYEAVPNPADPNPPNILGVYSHFDDIVAWTDTPNNLVWHGVFMARGRAGATGVVTARDWSTRRPQGQLRLLGSVAQRYYGPFGTFDVRTGDPLSGYGRDFRYDTRLARGLAPPFFSTVGRWIFRSENAGDVWRWCETAGTNDRACQ